MSVMERRLQLLLDRDRYRRVADEAERSGRSVAAVIREAIDLRFPSGQDARAVALTQLLERTKESSHSAIAPQGWAEIKAEMGDQLDGELTR